MFPVPIAHPLCQSGGCQRLSHGFPQCSGSCQLNDYAAALPSPAPPLASLPVAAPVALAPPAAMMPRRINARSKGQRGEREVIDLLQERVNHIRSIYALEPVLLQRNTLQAHVGGEDIHGLAPFSVEVKFQESEYQAAWWDQCIRQAGDTLTPILFYRRSRMPWTVKLRAYLNTPGDRDQVCMDIVTTLPYFMAWFEEAYDEACVNELQRLK